MTPDLTPAMPPAETAPDGRAAPEPLRMLIDRLPR